MDGHGRSSRLRDFLLGGVVGAFAALAASRRKAPAGVGGRPASGLAAFESAPCYRETLDRAGSSRLRS